MTRGVSHVEWRRRSPRHERSSDLSLYWRLLREARPYWPHMFGIFLISLLSTPLALLTPLPLKIAVDSALGSEPVPGFLDAVVPAAATRSDTAVLIFATGLLIAVTLLSQFQSLVSSLLATYTGEKLVLGFRSRLFRHVQCVSLAYHDMKGTGDSTYRIQYDATAIQKVALGGVIPFVTAIFTFGSMLYITARLDWQLAAVALIVSPLFVLLTQAYRPLLRTQSKNVKELESSALSIVQEVLGALRVVKAFGREDYEHERFVERSRQGLRARIRLTLAEDAYGMLLGATTAGGTAAVLFIGVRHVQTGSLTLGELLLVMGYLSQLYAPLKSVSKNLASLQASLASADRVFSLLDQAPDVPEQPNAKPLTRTKGVIAFRGVSFAYRKNQPVLHRISFEVPPRARVGIAGPTGAGKTTLMSLLIRFYDPTDGAILLDGVDLRDYKVADLRNQFGIVLQEPVLFSTSIAENLAYARPEASYDEIVAAARAASAHDFIMALPEGYDTQVGERGLTLSGGERQRLSLARAFLKDAPILVLDEPTSSVDTQTEGVILEAMDRLMQGRLSFMIAHRLSTLDICDFRVELNRGRLASVERTPQHDGGVLILGGGGGVE